MKRTFAIPTSGGRACAHFGHCEGFTLLEEEDGAITATRFVTPPAHQPGSYPRFLAELGVDVVLAGGMGGRAQELLRANGIQLHLGIAEEDPAGLVLGYLQDRLQVGDNPCTHGDGDDHHHNCRH